MNPSQKRSARSTPFLYIVIGITYFIGIGGIDMGGIGMGGIGI